jgi:periplasmic divalent cation tolerance protein
MAAEHLIVMTTTDSEDKAGALAAGVVDAKLGACAQVVGPITSVYRWEGAVQTDPEWRIEIKTTSDRAAALVDHIKANHTYDTPEVVAVPITGGSAEYLAWMIEESKA